jgi:protein tyrosine phosphatase (PTP) superfamily phosphohydrolase (DUF442 family)
VKDEARIGRFMVGAQPSADDIREFDMVVNFRMPDEAGNTTGRDIAGTGIAYHAEPLTADTLSAANIANVKAALANAPAKVYMHCQGGTRAAVVAAIIEAERAGSGAAGARKLLADADFDIEGRPYPAFIDRYFGG